MSTTSSTSSSGSSSLGIAGLASGFNWQSVVADLVAIDEAPEQQLETQETTLGEQNAALSSIKSALTSLQSDVAQLAKPSFFGSRIATASDTSLASATAAEGTGIGNYSFDVTQLATSAALNGTANVSAPLSPTDDVSTLTLSSAPFATPVTAGTFTVNGKQITIATSDTLQDVFNDISTATGGSVTGSYSTATDKISLRSSSPIILGSDTDTSNFLQAAQLNNNGTGTIASTNKLGAVNVTNALNQSNLSPIKVAPGTFTVNGQQVTIASTDTLQDVFDNISTATGGSVTASYDSTSNEITLNSSSPIVLGSASDTSNFLQAAQLTNNGTGTVTSANSLGALNLTNPIAQSNLGIAVSDGGSGNGAFIINGVTINFNASKDSIDDILNRINQSDAGVTASYNPTNNSFSLTDQSTGDVGISVQDVTGNFLGATGLAGGTLQRGNDLLYTVNGGNQLSSQSNTISAASSGITGLSVTALGKGIFNVNVAADTSTISTAITNFINQYNSVQSLISTNTTPITSSTGSVTPGLLEGNDVVYGLSDTLNSMMNAVVPGLSGAMQQIANLGYTSNGSSDSLTATDTTTLSNALATDLAGVQALFTNPDTGLATQLNTYLTPAVSSTGGLATEEASLTTQTTSLTAQINKIQTQAQANQTIYTNEFVAMETAESKINAQMAYLNQVFGTSGSTSGSSSSSSSSSGG